MFNNLTITNFQSHSKTSVNFHKGINVIIGSSDSGKSALLRALYWIIENRPSGSGLLRHGTKNAKAILTTAEGDAILRSKGLNNLYAVNKKKLEAIGTDVPEQVSSLLNISAGVNIQKQLDAPFLLSKSAGQVSKFLNEIVNLSDIDDILTSANSLKLSLGRDIKSVDKNLQGISDKIELIKPIEQIKKRMDLLIEQEKDYKEKQSKLQTLSEYINSIEKLQNKLAAYKGINKAKKLVKKLDTNIDGFFIIQNKHTDISNKLNKHSELSKTIKTFENTTKAKNLLKKLDKKIKAFILLEQENKKASKEYKRFQSLSNEIQSLKDCKHNWSITIQEYKNEMPDTCPLCGNTLSEDLL